MNSSEVTRLRKAGQLDEAHELALRLMAEQPDDVWNRRAFSWVLYALMKRELDNNNLPTAQAHFAAFEALGMPTEETMLHENFGHYRLRFHKKAQQADACAQQKDYAKALDILWGIFRQDETLAALPDLQYKIAWEIWHNLRTLPPDTGPALRRLNELTQMYRQLQSIKKPDLVHSVILSELLRLPQLVRSNFDLLDWFRFWIIPDHFAEKDWLPYVTQDKQLPSNAEKACNAWSKVLVENAGRMPEQELEDAIQRLETVAQAHPEFTWLPYYIGKIRLSGAGDHAAARQWLLPFVRIKHTEFWAWDLLAEAWIGESDDKAMACLCKALSCRTEPQFLVKVRLRLIQFLVKQQDYDHAKFEIETLIQLKESRKEQLPGDLIRLPLAPWYAAAANPGPQAQTAWYRSFLPLAESLVFADDLISGPAVVEGVDPNTGAVYFALRTDVRGRFPSRRFPKIAFKPGDLLFLKVLKKERNGQSFWELLSLEHTTQWPPNDLFREFTGPFRQFGKQPVGKVEEAFVPSHIVKARQLTDGQTATVRAVWAFDPKKQQYGWKAVR